MRHCHSPVMGGDRAERNGNQGRVDCAQKRSGFAFPNIKSNGVLVVVDQLFANMKKWELCCVINCLNMTRTKIMNSVNNIFWQKSSWQYQFLDLSQNKMVC